jgi:hypothetical protein
VYHPASMARRHRLAFPFNITTPYTDRLGLTGVGRRHMLSATIIPTRYLSCIYARPANPGQNWMSATIIRGETEAMTGFADFARFAGVYQTPSNIGQRGDCPGRKLAYHKVTVNGRASPAPQSQARGQAFPFIKILCNTYSKLLLPLL